MKGTAVVLEAFELARASFGAAVVVAIHDATPGLGATQGRVLEDGVLRTRAEGS